MKITKQLFLYWDKSRALSWMEYMTAFSFLVFNPKWKIVLFLPDRNERNYQWEEGFEDWLPKLLELKNVEERKVLFFDEEENLCPAMRADIRRWYALGEEGGVWSDFDVLYLRPIDDLVQLDENCSIGLLRWVNNRKEYIYPIGFLFAVHNDDARRFFSLCLIKATSRIPRVIKITKENYQLLGENVLREVAVEMERKGFFGIEIKDYKTIYPFGLSKQKWKKQFEYDDFRFLIADKNTFGIHWFAGDGEVHKKMKAVTPSNAWQERGIIGTMYEIYQTRLRNEVFDFNAVF